MSLARLAAAAIPVIVLDRATKLWVVEALDLKSVQAIDVVPPYLNLRMAWNDGVNFGLFGGGSDATRWVLVGLAVAISVALAVWGIRSPDRRVAWSAGIVIGGALGNVWDRLQYGAVADFLNMSCCGIANPFSFNLADAAIFLGAVGLILWTGDNKGT
jgi:signal peptidase II